MTLPTTIIVPGIAAYLERFLRPLAATSGDGVEIRQNGNGTYVVACEGRHAATITTREAGDLEPILVDATALATADPSKPIKLYRMTETSAAFVQADGNLATIGIAPGTLPASARAIADAVEGEIASGMTRTVFELDPRHLLAVAEALVATGAEKISIAVAPRWNALACMAATSDVSVSFVIAGETIVEPSLETAAEDDCDPLTFTIVGRKTRSVSQAKTIEPLTIPDDEIPF